jgi:acetolactate synthase-1/2/3 large subunit
MKIKVADYIANLLSVHGITNVFTVVGGGAMHLNNAFGQHKKLKCIYNHHEQASAIAAESFAKINNKLAVTCVTTGPGGTNAITGVLCAYLDNIPLLVISGQVRYATTVESSGLNLRQFGEQEYKIVESVKPMTKYAVMVKNPQDIKYHVERAIFEATTGRKGPCWIDVPLDVQASIIEDSDLRSFKPEKKSLYMRKIQNLFWTKLIKQGVLL